MNDRRRQRRTIGTLLVTAAAAYGTYRLARWYFGDDDDEEQLETAGAAATEQLHSERANQPQIGQHQHSHTRPSTHLSTTMRAARIAICREQVARSFPSFSHQIRRAIDLQTNVVEETKRLKALAIQSDNLQDQSDLIRQKALLWETIKVKSFTQAIATAYSHVLLNLALTVSTHVVFGRQTGLDGKREAHDQDSMAGAEIHRFVLQHLLAPFVHSAHEPQHSGLDRLVQSVCQAVAAQLAEWDVQDPAYLQITPSQLERAMNAVWNRVDQTGPAVDETEAGVIRFLFPTQQATDNATSTNGYPPQTLPLGAVRREVDSAQSQLDETLDVLESPVCRDAQRDCIYTCIKELQAKVFDGSGVSTPALPLAAILTRLRKVTKTFCDSDATIGKSNDYMIVMENLPSILELRDVSYN